MNYTYSYPRPAVTVDIILFNEDMEILLIKRKNKPFEGAWAFPGGFVDENEGLEDAARRELMEETCLEAGKLEQSGAFGQPGRDPRGHTISIVFTGRVIDSRKLQAADDATEARWFSLKDLPELAFDHQEILEYFNKKQNEGRE